MQRSTLFEIEIASSTLHRDLDHTRPPSFPSRSTGVADPRESSTPEPLIVTALASFDTPSGSHESHFLTDQAQDWRHFASFAIGIDILLPINV